MKNSFKKITVFILVSLLLVTLSGCNDLLNFNQKPDPLLTDINTKEEAYDFLVTTAKNWNFIKGEVSTHLITLPMDGHFDISARKGYIQTFAKDANDQKVVSKYYYLDNNIIYSCSYADDRTPTYEITDSISEVGMQIRINDYLSFIDNPTVDLSQVTFTKDEYHISLVFNLIDGADTYNIEVIYKNKSIKVSVGDKVTIIFKQDDANYFTNLNLDLSGFENLN